MENNLKNAEELKEIINDRDMLGLKIEQRDCLPKILNFLKSNINQKRYVEDKIVEYAELWQWVGKIFEKQGRIYEAKAIFESLYDELTIAQIKEKRYIHKGMPLVWIRDYANSLNQPWLSQRYMLLTIIEDSIATSGNIDPNKSGSYFRGVWYHNMGDTEFKKFSSEAFNIFQKNSNLGRFPEWILFNLINNLSIEYPSYREIDIFPLNRPFAKYWYDNICAEDNKKGSPFEDFCAFLLSCMPGFEVETRFKTSDYHFDALIRNKTNTEDYRSDLGVYIISESKNWSVPISPQEIAYFASKLLFHDIKAGIIFSQEGLTGKSINKHAALTLIKSFYKVGRIIMVITKEDIKNIIKKSNMINLLQSKYEESRFTL